MRNISEEEAGIENFRSQEAEKTGGILILDKPEGLTSAKAAARVKKLLRPRKIGHTGTLDPFATGVLILCLNEATRAADQITSLNKVYLSTLHFGVETDTLDKTGKILRVSDARFSEKDLIEVMQSFQGSCIQKVPFFSAVKVEGRRMYTLSRKGIAVEQPQREICIHSLKLSSFNWPEATIEVSCSKGTYIRQLASDIGQNLGSGAHVSALRRLSVGRFHLDQALDPEEFSSGAPVAQRLIPLNEALSHLPFARVENERILARLRNGQLDPEWERNWINSFRGYAGAVRIVTRSDKLAALWWPNSSEIGSRRLRIFPS
ncbi:MAG: tRNA pseudouridine(55) synthase TruB [Syntrophobacteraceae bacterium]